MTTKTKFVKTVYQKIMPHTKCGWQSNPYHIFEFSVQKDIRNTN